MAKKARSKQEPNRAQIVREGLKKFGVDAPAKQIQELGAQQGVEIAAAQISNIRTKLKEASSGGKKSKKHAAVGAITGEELVQVRNMAEKIGGVERTRKLLDILERLR